MTSTHWHFLEDQSGQEEVSLNPQFLLIIRPRCIKGCCRIIARYPVLCNEGGDICVGVAVEEAVVADAQADDDIEIGAGLVQEAGLEDRIAHCRTY